MSPPAGIQDSHLRFLGMGTALGETLLRTVGPSPSCPCWLEPQLKTSPPSVTAKLTTPDAARALRGDWYVTFTASLCRIDHGCALEAPRCADHRIFAVSRPLTSTGSICSPPASTAGTWPSQLRPHPHTRPCGRRGMALMATSRRSSNRQLQRRPRLGRDERVVVAACYERLFKALEPRDARRAVSVGRGAQA